MKIYILLFLLGTSTCLFGQAKPCIAVKDSILHKLVYPEPDQKPEPVGGYAQMLLNIGKQYKYPKVGDIDYAGKVYVRFVVEPNGKIDGARILRDPSGDAHLFGNELIPLLKTTKWKPGKCDGVNVPCYYVLPFSIDIREE